MTAQEKFARMILAMIDDDEWVAVVEDSIAAEDSIEWLFAPVEDDSEVVEDMLDREFWARGQW